MSVEKSPPENPQIFVLMRVLAWSSPPPHLHHLIFHHILHLLSPIIYFSQSVKSNKNKEPFPLFSLRRGNIFIFHPARKKIKNIIWIKQKENEWKFPAPSWVIIVWRKMKDIHLFITRRKRSSKAFIIFLIILRVLSYHNPFCAV